MWKDEGTKIQRGLLIRVHSKIRAVVVNVRGQDKFAENGDLFMARKKEQKKIPRH